MSTRSVVCRYRTGLPAGPYSGMTYSSDSTQEVIIFVDILATAAPDTLHEFVKCWKEEPTSNFSWLHVYMILNEDQKYVLPKLSRNLLLFLYLEIYSGFYFLNIFFCIYCHFIDYTFAVTCINVLDLYYFPGKLL